MRPLEGFKILDFCWIGAGALVTKTLAELGADVYRVESSTHPDNLRLSPPFRPGREGIEGSGYFASRNPGKQSVAIDMSTAAGRDVARELAGRVDLVASNFRPGIMERWGMTYAELAAANPSLLYLTMPMQGADGPHANYIGFGSTISALAGIVGLSGIEGRAPVGTGTHYPDHLPNPGHALVAVLAAVRHRRVTGEGQWIELSQLESTVNVVGPAIVESSMGHEPHVSGNRWPGRVPHDAYRTADDRWVAVSCPDEAAWRALCAALELDAVDDARFADAAGRARHEDELGALLDATVGARAMEDVLARLAEHGVPHALVKDSRDIVEDPLLRERAYWEDVEHPVIGRMPISRTPIRKVGVERAPVTRPPLLGEHTWDVLSTELGMSREDYDRLVDDGVLA
ncbi:CaiB/BaiF CoA transferase family protein [Agromyces sp. SYSU T00194]|uniref:CaiB/BaiF CoA transferase family protein n=1 Tax=Agromyces chitinivorans TaxID=3158560 RepID=UPI003397BFB0